VPLGRGATGGRWAPAARLAGGATSLDPKGDCFRGDRRVGPCQAGRPESASGLPAGSYRVTARRVDPNQLPLLIGSLRSQLLAQISYQQDSGITDSLDQQISRSRFQRQQQKFHIVHTGHP
jgi:hypothetical protein